MFSVKDFTTEEVLDSFCCASAIYSQTPEENLLKDLVVLNKWFIKETEVCIVYDEVSKVIYVAYRGTSSAKDVFRDMNFFVKEWNGVRLHRGFYNAYSMVKDIGICDELEKSLETNLVEKIIFTGHSLGGALAIIHFYDFAKKMKAKETYGLYLLRTITYGAPRVFVENSFEDKDLEAYLTERILRIANKDDLVNSLPPRWLKPFGDNFKHIGNFLRIGTLDKKGDGKEHKRAEYYKTISEALGVENNSIIVGGFK